MLWAGRSVWHDRHVGIVEVPGSNPGPSTTKKRVKALSEFIDFFIYFFRVSYSASMPAISSSSAMNIEEERNSWNSIAEAVVAEAVVAV